MRESWVWCVTCQDYEPEHEPYELLRGGVTLEEVEADVNEAIRDLMDLEPD